MTPAETAGLTFAELVEYVLRAGPLIAAAAVWYFGNRMERSNKRRAETEKDRHEQIMASFKQAAEDRKAALAQADEDRKAALADAAEDRKVTQGMLAALQELIRRTSLPSSQAGPQPRAGVPGAWREWRMETGEDRPRAGRCPGSHTYETVD